MTNILNRKSLVAAFVAALLLMSLALTVFAAAPDGTGPWADSAPSSAQGDNKNGTDVLANRSVTGAALGVAESTGTPYDAAVVGSFFALGFGGTITLEFENAIVNGAGSDLRVYEVTGGSTYPDETATVEASHNGTDWVTLGTATRDEDFDLGDLPCAAFVRITDTSNAALFEATADGFDLDGAKALNSSTEACDAASSIDIEKSASSLEVFPGEEVTYTYEVTNTGDFEIDDVVVTDDKCAPVEYVSGDAGDDGILGLTETWVYECTMELDETTTNIAEVTGNDPWNHEVTDEDEVTVAVADAGCTLTQGYWKNHSSESKHVDPTWNGQENTAINGIVGWLSIFQTAPKNGDAWYSLAHQWIAATLNVQAGADDTDVATELADAEALLGSYLPNVLTGKNKDAIAKADRAEAIALAGILGSFNEGDIGPGHCSDDEEVI